MTRHLSCEDVTLEIGRDPEPGRSVFPEPSHLVTELIESSRLNGWSVEERTPWIFLNPPAENLRIQGWKLHVSATVWSAPEVLRACMPILLQAHTPFKFASSVEGISWLNDFRCPRGNSGKFLTVYPRDLNVFRDLANLLHQATGDLVGPTILSDAPYRPGSLVHYRYGAFDGHRALSNDGTYRDCILDPDTNPVEDYRMGAFSPPPWVVLPFEPTALADAVDGAPTTTPGQVVLSDRYEIASALRHANKGGVYRAVDRRSGCTVILKEARPHVGTDEEGLDARDYLRHEGAVLRHLAGLGIVPEVVEEFEQGGHAFLVEEFLPGQRFVDRVTEVIRTGEGRLGPTAMAELALKLATLLRTVHERGVVVRDFTPNNLLTMPDGTIRLVDLELAAVRRSTGHPWCVRGAGMGTPGVSAPEQFGRAEPAPSADLFSLGATLLQAMTHRNPDLPQDDAPGRALEPRVAELLAPPLAEYEAPPWIRHIITGLMRTDPTARLPLDEVLRAASDTTSEDGRFADVRSDEAHPPRPVRRPATASSGPRAVPGAPRPPANGPPSEGLWGELGLGILEHLAAAAAAPDDGRPWPETTFGSRGEPCAVQHGMAGTLAVLARLVGPEAPATVDELIGVLLPRVVRHLDRAPHRLPGLHFGAAGTAWALGDLGLALDRADLTDRALRLARSLPTVWPNPDVAHGLAGLGMCLLHLAEQAGDADLARRAVRCAETIVAAADSGDSELGWTVPGSFDSELAGYRSYGFAHGLAGIGAFLLAAGQAADRDDLDATARRCADTLLTVAVHRSGAAYWPDGPGSSALNVWWCNGSGGVGTFLCRAYARTGESRYLDGAADAARAVMAARFEQGTAYCHGLAGNGDFLLDLAEASGDPTFADGAHVIGQLLWARRVYRQSQAVLVDESGQNVTGGFGAGLSGHLAFLVRLRFGGPRLFHPPISSSPAPRPADP